MFENLGRPVCRCKPLDAPATRHVRNRTDMAGKEIAMSEDVQKYRPSPLLWRMLLTLLVANTLIALLFMNVSLRPGTPKWLAVLVTYFLINIAIERIGSLYKGDSVTWRTVFERHRTHNRIGFQRVWMLDGQNQLTSRIERRDHQNAQLNTSEFALYEKLGGWGGRRYELARKSGSCPEKSICSHMQVARAKDVGDVRVRGLTTQFTKFPSRYDVSIYIGTLVLLVNLTNGDCIPRAIARLMELLLAERYEKDNRYRELKGAEAVNLELRRQLSAYQAGYQMCQKARNGFTAIVDLANKRGARISDLQKLASESLEKMGL